MRSIVTLSIIALFGASFADAGSSDLASKAFNPIIKRDVVVIGGGSSGTYAAVKLRRMGKSVVVVERQAAFGGHTATYHVPGTNTTIDYGVQGYGDESVTREQFASFGIPLDQAALSETGFGVVNYVDFRNGQAISNFNFSVDLRGYQAQSEKYPYLSYSTRLPTPVPKDLLLPFKDFLAKYGLESITYNMFYSLEGFGDLLSQTTLYILRYFNREYLGVFGPDSSGALVTKRRYNQELYKKSQEFLGEDALVNSRVISAIRTKNGVTVIVRTPKGIRTIAAKKLLISIPPLASTLTPFGMDGTEKPIFTKFTASGWYVGLIRASGLAENFGYQNTRSDTPYNLPRLPALYQMSPTQVRDIYLVRYGSPESLPDTVVRSDIVKTFDRVRARVLGNRSKGLAAPDLVAYSSHYPFNLHVSAGDIEQGFYNKLDDLQGYRSTWYTGAAIISHATGTLWNFTDHLVDRMFES